MPSRWVPTAHIATSDPAAMRAAKGTFDIVLNTVSADIPIADYVRLLKPAGVVVNVGLPPSPYSISPGSLIGGNKAVAGSSIGGIAETQEMLDFCAEHGIAATIEVVSADEVDEVWDRVVDGAVRYRAVIDTSTITPGAERAGAAVGAQSVQPNALADARDHRRPAELTCDAVGEGP